MLIITILSLLMAATMGWLALRLLREEQRRSQARVDVLAAALDSPSAMRDYPVPLGMPGPRLVTLDADGAEEFFGPANTFAPAHVVAQAAPAPAVVPVAPPPLPAARQDAETIAAEPYLDHGAVESRDERPMFGDASDAGPARDDRRWLAIAAVAVVAILGVFVLRAAWGSAAIDTRSAANSSSVGATGAAGIPMELVSLGHERRQDRLVVRGLVRNPVSASPRTGTSASVFLFDGEGGFLGSGRALLDTPKLGAGDEAPFEVTLPDNPDVRRYRVTFRSAEGDVVPHLDRRGAALSATNGGPDPASR